LPDRLDIIRRQARDEVQGWPRSGPQSLHGVRRAGELLVEACGLCHKRRKNFDDWLASADVLPRPQALKVLSLTERWLDLVNLKPATVRRVLASLRDAGAALPDDAFR
jgi:hypothetical protein